ncbi:hypothetical protein BJX62DRAFT_135722 [Aspergillus germanicus]
MEKFWINHRPIGSGSGFHRHFPERYLPRLEASLGTSFFLGSGFARNSSLDFADADCLERGLSQASKLYDSIKRCLWLLVTWSFTCRCPGLKSGKSRVEFVFVRLMRSCSLEYGTE